MTFETFDDSFEMVRLLGQRRSWDFWWAFREVGLLDGGTVRTNC